MSDKPDQSEDPIVEKIRKLLRIDEDRGATEAEVTAAIAMATKLAHRHNIDLASIDAAEITATGEPIVDEVFRPQRSGGGFVEDKLPVANKYLVWLLQSFFAVRVVEGTTWVESELRNAPSLNIIGRRTNVQIAIYVYGFLYNEFQRRWRAYKQKENAPMAARGTFYNGMYQALRKKLDETMGETMLEKQQEIVAPTGTSMAMVLRTEEEKVEAAMKEAHPRLVYVKRSVPDVHDYSSLYAGREAGAQININPALKK